MAPHVLIIPGSFCPPKPLYDDVLAGLTSRGLSASAHGLVTVGPKFAPEQRAQPPRSMYDDAASIAAEVERLAAVHPDGVVVVAHSYAGIPVSQSLQVLNDKSKHKDGDKQRLRNGGLKAIIYLAAVVPEVGVPLAGPDAGAAEGERDVDTEKAPNTNSIKFLDDGYMAQGGELCVDLILNDMADRARGVELIDQEIGVHSARSFTDSLTYPGWNDVASAAASASGAGAVTPLTWIKPRNDACVVPAYQDAMVAGVRASLAKAGLDAESALRVVDFESGHCPNITQPAKLAEVIAGIVGA